MTATQVSVPDRLLDAVDEVEMLAEMIGGKRQIAFASVRRAAQDLEGWLTQPRDLERLADGIELRAAPVRHELHTWAEAPPTELTRLEDAILKALAGRDKPVPMRELEQLVAHVRPPRAKSPIRPTTVILQERGLIAQPIKGYYSLNRPRS